MARVIRVEIKENGYQLTFQANQRPTGSIEPLLVPTADLKSEDIPRETKRKAYALAAIVFNKFKK